MPDDAPRDDVDLGGPPDAQRDRPTAAAAPTMLRIPALKAQELLRNSVHLVADVPQGSSPQLVWVQGGSELLVHLDTVELTCLEGLVAVAVRVGCDQLPKDALVTVPLGVGTRQRPAGLVMSTLTRPTGPESVVGAWSEPIVAFAWEALVHLARTVCAAAGALVPAAIGAEPRVLLVQPAARHAFTRRLADVERIGR